jgi:hypothetical protein
VKPDIDSLGFASTSSNLVDCATGRSAGLMMCEMLAERPMLVEQRHAGRGVRIQHLLGGDDLDLAGIDVEPSSDRAISSQASWICCNFVKSQSAPQTGVRLSRSWRGFLLFAAAVKEVVKHRKDLAAVADLADRQRRSIGAQALIQRPKR